jgi:hypothetical protein
VTRPRQAPFARRARGAAAAAGVALALAAACSENGAPPASVPGREGRFGSLRDLVLFDRPGLSAAHALFVDRFEVTRADWEAFAATPEGRAAGADEVPTIGEPTLPVASVDLRQARAFARWRFLRLPRSDEWWFVAVGEGNSLFPWGNREDATRANTGELGLGQPTPVGTFESGRRAADQPYDLVGNVSEWTETVSPRWWDGGSGVRGAAADAVAGMPRCRRAVLANPMLALWQGPGGTVPLGWLALAGGAQVPRDVVGSDFQSPMSAATLVEPVLAGDRRARTGLRLYATAAELLLALTHDAAAPAPADVVQLRRFVQRRGHRAVLAQAWAELVLEKTRPLGGGPLAAILRDELGYGDGDAPR